MKNWIVVLVVMFAVGASASIVDNFNDVDGSPDLTWEGDTADWSVQATDNGDNEGAGAFRKTNPLSKDNYQDSSFVTDITTELALDTEYAFSGFVCAEDAQAVNNNLLGNYAALVLLSDSSDNADITAGDMNGYRIGVFSGDQVELQKASGSGWSTLQAGPSSSLRLNNGFNFSVTIDSDTGNYSWGYFEGGYTNTVAEGNTGTDGSFSDPTGTTYGGFTYSGKGGISYYVDAYNVEAIPEPATLGVIGLMGIAYLFRRRLYRDK